ncbi:MAG: 4Fe-4S binding protein [Odoribacteraceae bacterium]|jgi:ferredoxin|nr:4Fe-4S binding protein [Odoribacteraceae bacterium]
MIKKLVLSFPVDATDRPLVYDLIRVHDVSINILKAEIQPGKTGSLLAEFEADEAKINEAIAYLNDNGVLVSPVSSKVSYDQERCIDCGNCVSACFSRALTIGAPDWKLRLDPERCIACKLCLKACPLKLFKIEFADM